MNFPFELPVIAGETEKPIWNINGFLLGNKRKKVLSYSENSAGWDDSLTVFTEENDGDNHPIALASRKHTISQIKRFCKMADPVILEIGCTSGFMLKDLKKNFPHAFLIGADVIPEKLEALADKMPNVPLLQFDLTQCPLPDNSIDVLVMLNVLEHIEQDEKALLQIKRILRPGGLLILEVPAGPHLYDVYDKFLRHFRRYQLSALEKVLKKIEFKIEKKSHLGVFIYPFFARVKKKNLSLSEAEQKEIVAKEIKNSAEVPLLNFVMNLELLLGRYLSYPVGIRCIVTAKK